MMKKIKFGIFAVLTIVLTIITSGKELHAQTIENQFEEYTYIKDTNENITSVWQGEEIMYTAIYDENDCRISKNGKEMCQFIYVEERLEGEVRDGIEIDYLYTYDEERDIYHLYGFSYNNTVYIYNINDFYRIEGIKTENNEDVCRYIYGDNGMEIVEVQSLSNGVWIQNDNPNFIGNINRLRFRGEYFDIETKWYYNGVYMDSISTDVIGLTKVYDSIPEHNPYVDELLTTFAVDDLDLEVQTYAESLLADSEFNNAVPASATWYNDIPTIELLARVIYGENTIVTTDQNAIAWVILNRLENSSFPNDIKGVLIDDGQFETVSKPSNDVTGAQNSQNTEWESAVYLACLFYTTLDKSDWNSLGIPPVGMQNQLYFTGWSTLNSFSCSGGVMYKGSYKVYNVYVVGYGAITTSGDISSVYNAFNNSKRNIYYDTKWEK